MKKISMLLCLSFTSILQAFDNEISYYATLTTTPIEGERPQLAFLQAQDIHTPKKRNGQYVRTGELTPQDPTTTPAGKNPSSSAKSQKKYYFGEYIDKATRARSIAIEENPIVTQPVYKAVKGCSKTRIGYIKSKEDHKKPQHKPQPIAIYPFNPLQGNLDAASVYYAEEMVKWAKNETEADYE